MKKVNLLAVTVILALVIAITTPLHAEPSAVIITGCLAGKLVTETYAAAKDTVKRDEFWNDSYLMWELFYKNYHWPEKKANNDYDGIHFLYGNGRDFPSTSPRYQPRIQTYDSVQLITDYPAYRQDVTNIFNWLATGDSGQGIKAMTVKDPLFVYTSDHGVAEDTTGEHVSLAVMGTFDDRIFDTTFARMVDQIPCDRRVFWMGQCFSGGFINDLQNNRTIIHTACSKTEVAWVADNKTLNDSPYPEIEVYNGKGYRHDEYSFHLINSLRGSAIFGTSYDDPAPVDADLNWDGKISVYESWLYERDHKSTPETPQFSDMGNLASSTFLEYPVRIIDTVKNQFIDLGNINIYKIMAPEGDSLTQLTFNGRNFFPTWSPDGKRIAWDTSYMDSLGANVIWIMDADGNNKKDISQHQVGEWRMPDWYTDGRIVHIRYPGGSTFSSEIFIMDSSGQNPIRITNNNNTDYYPKVSPTGTKILFSSQADGQAPRIWVVNSDGSKPIKLTETGGDHPAWSPDGTKIVYCNTVDGRLWTMNADGTNKQQLTFNWCRRTP
ncbi:PD40 domain-containing protein [candidate division TA06 bacterium]|uniref:PD40 domain-containing protein n=1 Tax=candidate division TA06 bacterium TaxID=2250710 RepID=A0A933IDZ7_UNCT6|nr:PD40 domain-containing protein [candidate division TA06 bacterium]